MIGGDRVVILMVRPRVLGSVKRVSRTMSGVLYQRKVVFLEPVSYPDSSRVAFGIYCPSIVPFRTKSCKINAQKDFKDKRQYDGREYMQDRCCLKLKFPKLMQCPLSKSEQSVVVFLLLVFLSPD